VFAFTPVFLLILSRRITKESLDAVQRGHLTFQRVFEARGLWVAWLDLGGFGSERDVMTVTRIMVVAALGAVAVGATSQSPSAADLQKQYVGQQWVVNYSLVPCSHQVAEITALEIFKEKGQATKPAKGESVAIEPPGQRVRFTLRCPDGNTYTREIAVKDFPGEFAKPPSR